MKESLAGSNSTSKVQTTQQRINRNSNRDSKSELFTNAFVWAICVHTVFIFFTCKFIFTFVLIWSQTIYKQIYHISGYQPFKTLTNSVHSSINSHKKLSYHRVTARCVLSVVILPITMQQCRNYLYDKSWPNRWYEVGSIVGGNVS